MFVLFWPILLFTVRGSNVDTDVIFHTNKSNRKIQSGFKGRVSLLEPDVRRMNCSIIISDLIESDSGSYQLRVNGILQNWRSDGFTFSPKATVSVSDLIQKPTVMIPPITEGQQTTLTCTAPGLCSGSGPEITWTWRGAGENHSHITGNKTAFTTAVAQRHSSILTFNSSAEHHGTSVSCKVSFTNNITTEQTVTLNVTYMKTIVITGDTTVEMGDALNLTCSVDSFPPSHITWTKLGSNTNLCKGTDTDLQNDTGSAKLFLPNVTAEHSGQYICIAKHLDTTVTIYADVTVTYLKKPVITGVTTVKEGDALNLTCNVESFSPSFITWTKLGSNKNLQKETTISLQNDTETATLVIRNVTVEYSGLYICTAKHQITTLIKHAEVTVTFFPRILSSSACEVQSGVLTCVCISQGFPIPTIKWPLLETLTEYSGTTEVSNHTVNLNFTVSIKDRNYTTVECVSCSDVGEAKGNLTVTITHELNQEDMLKKLLIIVKQPPVITAFLIGITLSATICCLSRKCHRKKHKSSENMAETMEMVTIQAAPLIDAGQAVENEATHDQEAAEGGTEAAGQSAPDSDVEPKEAEYSDIDFSLLKRKSPTGAEGTQETTETEYAEIKKEEKEERQDDGGEDGEMLEGNREEEVIIGEDKETKQCMSPEEEGGEDMAVYSNVNEIMVREKTDCLNHRRRMFVLIWATLLFTVRSDDANAVASPGETQNCQNGFCVTLSEAEITAEAGLCVAIPCYFTTDPGFSLERAVWYKCDPSKQNCTELTLHLNNTNPKAQSGFRSRVSLLEPDLSQRNCSIIINDLTKSDSGSYQLGVNGTLNGATKEYTSHRATVTVKDLVQKPTVMIPPLTEGQQATLTCTAPGLCSGSDPEITWTWRGAGESHSHITGNITANQGQSSTLTFNSSVIHHGTEVACKVSFTGDMTTVETVTLNVTYVRELKITGTTTVEEGDALNLTCSIESFSQSLITWTKLGSKKNLHNETKADLQNEKKARLIIPNVTAEHSGQYICTAKHLNNSVTESINITVMYVKEPEITGGTTVKEGDTLKMTCSVDSFPPSVIAWTKLGLNKNLSSETVTDLHNDTRTATVVIPNVTTEHAGQYICNAKHRSNNLKEEVNITVILYPKILKSSGCINQSEVLTCMCISQGVPLPSIKWPMLENHTEYSSITTASNHTVNSTVIVTVKDHSNTAIECVSSNENGDVKGNLIINRVEQEEEGLTMKMLRILTRLEIIIAFLIGALISAITCWLMRKCLRKKRRTYGNPAETLEMVTRHEDSLRDAGQAAEEYQAIDQEAAERGGGVAVGKSDVEYSNLDFSLIKRKSAAEAGTTQGTTETDYAEIKKEKAEARQDGEGKEEEEMLGEDEETKHCVPDEREGEDVALYSNVEDVMGFEESVA
ncbi:hemicentin-1-like [Enoplosus armatus]|uniref:hemicentin-1-like n=1 Tax=Enoplosus armatus TaxID=215367 RepID=UPI00399499A2